MKNVIFTIALLAAFNTLMANTNTSDRNGDPVNATPEHSFQDFLNQFPKASLPFSFTEQELQHQLDVRSGKFSETEKTAPLSWEYYDFLPDLEEIAEYSNMPIYPEPVAAFETEAYYAVVYNTGRAFAKQFKSYNVALFDKEGNHQATYCIAGVQPGMLTAATLDEKLHVTIREYAVQWENNPSESGIKGNNVTGINLLSTKQVNLAAPDKSFLTPYQMPGIENTARVADCK